MRDVGHGAGAAAQPAPGRPCLRGGHGAVGAGTGSLHGCPLLPTVQRGELPHFGVLHFGVTLLPLQQLSSCRGLCPSHRGAPRPTDVTPAPCCRRRGDPCSSPCGWICTGTAGQQICFSPSLFQALNEQRSASVTFPNAPKAGVSSPAPRPRVTGGRSARLRSGAARMGRAQHTAGSLGVILSSAVLLCGEKEPGGRKRGAGVGTEMWPLSPALSRRPVEETLRRALRSPRSCTALLASEFSPAGSLPPFCFLT